MCGGWNKWRGATMGPRGRGRAQGGGCALDPRSQVLASYGVSSVPYILKYSRKNHITFSGAFGELLFLGYFLLHG